MKLKKYLLKNNGKNNVKDNLLSQKDIRSITYFPCISESICNFWKCLFCLDFNCKNNFKIREYITEYLLVQND